MNQERIALTIVAVTFGLILLRVGFKAFGGSFAHWLLKRGNVKLAMRLHASVRRSGGCSKCH